MVVSRRALVVAAVGAVAALLTVVADLDGVGGARRAGPVDARPVANIYYYNLPDPGIGRWDVHLTVDGPSGVGNVTYSLHGVAGLAPVRATPATGSGGNKWPAI